MWRYQLRGKPKRAQAPLVFLRLIRHARTHKLHATSETVTNTQNHAGEAGNHDYKIHDFHLLRISTPRGVYGDLHAIYLSKISNVLYEFKSLRLFRVGKIIQRGGYRSSLILPNGVIINPRDD